MTPQEIFNKTYISVSQQGFRCYDSNAGQCMYQAELNGQVAHCAVGFLFKDENVDSDILLSRDEIRDLYLEDHNLPEWVEENLTLLSRIQVAHDRSEDKETFVSAFQNAMRGIAVDYDLKVPAWK